MTEPMNVHAERMRIRLHTLLVVDGFVTAVIEMLFLPSFVGASQVPVSIAVAVIVNALLVWGASTVSQTGVGTVAPAVMWLIAVGLGMSRGPGGDGIFLSNVYTLAFIGAGIVSALVTAIAVSRRGQSSPQDAQRAAVA